MNEDLKQELKDTLYEIHKELDKIIYELEKKQINKGKILTSIGIINLLLKYKAN